MLVITPVLPVYFAMGYPAPRTWATRYVTYLHSRRPAITDYACLVLYRTFVTATTLAVQWTR